MKIVPGHRTGKMTVTADTGKRKNSYKIWQCICDCGNTVELDTRAIQRGLIRDCGCETKVRPGQNDLTGQKFGRLLVLEPTERRDANGTLVWRCRCDCGNETTVRHTNLTEGKTRSCGCMQIRTFRQKMEFVDGTSVRLLEKAPNRLSSNNSSGHNGVYLNRKNNRWIAQITFKRKTYYLGSFLEIEDAVMIRKEAEKQIYGEFLEWYYEQQGKMEGRRNVQNEKTAVRSFGDYAGCHDGAGDSESRGNDD